MGSYGDVAIRAMAQLGAGYTRSPVEAWSIAAREVFPTQDASREKGCPKASFLGLCEEGLLRGVPPGQFGAGPKNKSYALEAVRILASEPSAVGDGPKVLWTRVIRGEKKASNHQMDVVLALWSRGLIEPGRLR